MKVNWHYVHSLQFGRWSTVLFRYYLLRSDTVAPSGLLARLCHAFLVFASIDSILCLIKECMSPSLQPYGKIFYCQKSNMGATDNGTIFTNGACSISISTFLGSRNAMVTSKSPKVNGSLDSDHLPGPPVLQNKCTYHVLHYFSKPVYTIPHLSKNNILYAVKGCILLPEGKHGYTSYTENYIWNTKLQKIALPHKIYILLWTTMHS